MLGIVKESDLRLSKTIVLSSFGFLKSSKEADFRLVSFKKTGINQVQYVWNWNILGRCEVTRFSQLSFGGQ